MKKHYIILISLFLIFGIDCSSKNSKLFKKNNITTLTGKVNNLIYSSFKNKRTFNSNKATGINVANKIHQLFVLRHLTKKRHAATLATTDDTITFNVTGSNTNEKVVNDIVNKLPATKTVTNLTADVDKVKAGTDFPYGKFGITKASLNLPNDADDVRTTITYSHAKIEKDGDTTITFTVTRKKGQSKFTNTKNVKITVTGLNNAKVNTALAALNATKLELLTTIFGNKNTKLPNDSTVTAADILTQLKALSDSKAPLIKSLTVNQKALITAAQIAVNPDNARGNLQVAFTQLPIGNATAATLPAITITGFKTNQQFVDAAIQTLADTILNSYTDTNKLPSVVDDATVRTQMRTKTPINNLTASQLALIKDTDFVIGKDDDSGKITVTIKNHGNDKSLTSGAFKTNQNVVDKVLTEFTNKTVNINVTNSNATTLLNNSNNIPAATNVSVTSATRLYDDSSFVVPSVQGTTVTYTVKALTEDTTTPVDITFTVKKGDASNTKTGTIKIITVKGLNTYKVNKALAALNATKLELLTTIFNDKNTKLPDDTTVNKTDILTQLKALNVSKAPLFKSLTVHSKSFNNRSPNSS